MEERGVGAALTLILRLASGQLIGGLTAAAVHAGGSRAIVAISRLSCGHLDFGVEGVVVVDLPVLFALPAACCAASSLLLPLAERLLDGLTVGLVSVEVPGCTGILLEGVPGFFVGVSSRLAPELPERASGWVDSVWCSALIEPDPLGPLTPWENAGGKNASGIKHSVRVMDFFMAFSYLESNGMKRAAKPVLPYGRPRRLAPSRDCP